MDSDENAEIMSDNTHHKRRRRKKDKKNKLIFSPNEKKLLNNIAIFLAILIIFFLISYIFQYISLFRETKNMPHKINRITKITNTVNHFSIEQDIEKYVNSLPKVRNDEILEFRKINSENILFDRDKYKRSEDPDVSIILTLNNQAHCIHKALRSIQNQSLKNIEIIVAIDCSQDNSTETIKKYMKEDERIILIEHDTKVGTMKNRNDGIRKAKGKYITVVDGDDALIQKDILKYSFNIATMGNIDIVEFYGYMYYKHNVTAKIHFHNTKGIIFQPNLRKKFFYIPENNKSWGILCRSIWGKLIKNELFQKTLEKMGKYADDFIIIYEDTMISITLYQIAQTYYLFKEVGYYYSRDDFFGRFPFLPNKNCKIKEVPNKGLDTLKFLNYLYDSMNEDYIERRTIYFEFLSINNNFLKFSKYVNDHFDMFYRVVDGLLNSKYLTTKEKEQLKEIRNEIENKEKNLKK